MIAIHHINKKPFGVPPPPLSFKSKVFLRPASEKSTRNYPWSWMVHFLLWPHKSLLWNSKHQYKSLTGLRFFGPSSSDSVFWLSKRLWPKLACFLFGFLPICHFFPSMTSFTRNLINAHTYYAVFLYHLNFYI